MTNLIIGGISGIGKSFLEGILEKDYGFIVNTKYMTRPYRPGEEDNPRIVSLSDKKFEAMITEFFPIIHQTGFKYGYKLADIRGEDKHTIAVPVKDVLPHIQKLENELIPIILILNPDNLKLLIKRIKVREDYENRSTVEKRQIDSNIVERMEIAKKEIKQVEQLQNQIENYGGKVFVIKNDRTIFEEVIPFIQKL